MTDVTVENYTSTRKYRKNLKFVTKEKIIKTCEDHFGFTLEQMASKKRPQDLSDARQVTIYLLSTFTRLSYASIGGIFGGRDHSTVNHAREAVVDRMDVYENVKNEVELLKRRLKY